LNLGSTPGHDEQREVDLSESFGELLRRARLEAGLTQEELAERAEVSDRGVRYLEHGLRRPSRDTVERLGRALALNAGEQATFRAAARPVRPRAAVVGAVPPNPPHPLIGREAEVRRASGLLRSGEVRLLTFTGPGGVGKTRLALEVVRELPAVPAAAVVWVPLASLAEGRLVPWTIAGALGVVQTTPSVLNALRNALVQRPTLLVLDNFEHVLDAADVVSELIDGCPRLTVLVTSRAPLQLRAEREFPVVPLPTPREDPRLPVHAVAASPAVDLFLRRAQAVRPDFALTKTNASAVAAICRCLDGLPLALELAAARTRILPPHAMLEHLADRLGFLTGGAGDLPARQRTMRATVAWSHELLGQAAQAVFARLTVFDGSFSLAAVEAVLDDPDDPMSLLDALESLQRTSLLVVVDGADDEPRFRMLGTIRDFGRERLAPLDAEELRGRHAHHYLALAEEAALGFQSTSPARWLVLLEQDQDNLRAALAWFLDHPDAAAPGLRLSVALSWFWYVRGYASEGRAWLSAFLVQTESLRVDESRAAALLGSGQLAHTQGDFAAARRLLAESIELRRSLGDQRGTADALLAAGFTARIQEDVEPAHRLLGEALELARASGHPFVVAAALHHLGLLAMDAHGDTASARRLLEESLSQYRALGFPRFIALLQLALGDVARAEHDYGRARQLLSESLLGMSRAGEKLGLHGVLDSLAGLAADQSEWRRAITLASAAERLRATTGSRSWPVVERDRVRWLGEARRALTELEYAAAWETGQAMGVEHAVDYGRAAG
jgi:predicted ATPase/DNA-binding XRE family transcriptional regulator